MKIYQERYRAQLRWIEQTWSGKQKYKKIQLEIW